MGITRNSFSKRRATGGRQNTWRKKRKFELGRPAANTRLGPKRIHEVRVRGGHIKFRALKLEAGTFSWPTESLSRKARIIDVVYNSSSNELVRTKTLVKNAIVQVDATPFRNWYAQHYGKVLGLKKKKNLGADADEAQEQLIKELIPEKRSKSVERKLEARNKDHSLDSLLEEQFAAGRLYACISSRPGQSGRADGYILEGKELEFYLKKITHKKKK